MENGRIQAQGTYKELATNEYMMQILDIHEKHKKENQEVAESGLVAKKKSLDDMLDGFEDELEMEEAAMNKSASVPIKAAKKSVSR